MSKFKQVLSDDWLPLEFQSGNGVPVTALLVNRKTLRSIIEQTEQAVLAKQAEQQEPAAMEWCWRMDWLRHNGFNPADPLLWERSGQAYAKQMRGRTSSML